MILLMVWGGVHGQGHRYGCVGLGTGMGRVSGHYCDRKLN